MAQMNDKSVLINVKTNRLVWLVIPAVRKSTGRKYVISPFPDNWPNTAIITIIPLRYLSGRVLNNGLKSHHLSVKSR